MIEKHSILHVADNTPIRYVRCIGGAKTARRKPFFIGDRLILSVRKLRLARSQYRRGQKLRAVLVRTKKILSTSTGLYYGFQHNRVVFLTEKGTPLANRVKGPLPYILRTKGYTKLFSLGAYPI